MAIPTDIAVGRGSFTWATGQWTTVAQRLRLNDAGQSNGEQELFVNGQSVLHLTGLQIAADANTKIYGIMAQTFFVSFICFLHCKGTADKAGWIRFYLGFSSNPGHLVQGFLVGRHCMIAFENFFGILPIPFGLFNAL
jgi:hypothetical protein